MRITLPHRISRMQNVSSTPMGGANPGGNRRSTSLAVVEHRRGSSGSAHANETRKAGF